MRPPRTPNITNLKYFPDAWKIPAYAWTISRTGYTRLGFEVWMPWKDAVKLWDALIAKGKSLPIHPAEMIALDIASESKPPDSDRVDTSRARNRSSKRRKFSGGDRVGKRVDLKKENFVVRERWR